MVKAMVVLTVVQAMVVLAVVHGSGGACCGTGNSGAVLSVKIWKLISYLSTSKLAVNLISRISAISIIDVENYMYDNPQSNNIS